ncbi:MAG: phage major capsid protein [Pseudomonadota bacterium]
MSIQALRERLQASSKAANHLLSEKGSQAWSAEDQKTFDNHMDEVDRIKAQIKAHERMLEESRDNDFEDAVKQSAKKGGGEFTVKDAVALYMRYGDKVTAEQAVQIRNAMSTTTGSEGGFTVATEVPKMVIDALKAYGGMREIADVIATAAGNDWQYPASDGTAEIGEIVGQNTAASGADIVFAQVPLVVYKYSSKKLALPWELIQDSAIDVVQFVINRLAVRLGRITNQHYTVGTGTAQPWGIMARATSGKVGTTGQTLTVIHDDLVDLKHSVNRSYRKKAKFLMADSSLKVVRKIKDTAGRPIFTPAYEFGITQDAPDLLLGDPIAINDDVAVMAANAKSIGYGDAKQYQIRDVMETIIRRFDDSAFALNGQVGFCGWQRTGGNLLDTAAFKYYQNSAT